MSITILDSERNTEVHLSSEPDEVGGTGFVLRADTVEDLQLVLNDIAVTHGEPRVTQLGRFLGGWGCVGRAG